MTNEQTYRVPASSYEPGKELRFGIVVDSPEGYIIHMLRQAIVSHENPTGKQTRAEWMGGHRRIEALAHALAAVQAGSSYFMGDEPRKLIQAHMAALRSEGALDPV